MAEPAPEQPRLILHVNPETGEAVPEDPKTELELAYDELSEKYKQALSTIGKQKKELANIREVAPDSKQIREALEFWQTETGHLKADIAPGGKRWDRARTLLARKSMTVEKLKRAVVGRRSDAFLMGDNPQGTVYDDVTTLWRDEVQVERLARLAGEGRPSRRAAGVSDLSPYEAAVACIRREFGTDAVDADEDVAWSVCVLHPDEGGLPMRLRESGEPGTSIELVCAHGCEHGDLLAALRGLYGLQAARDPHEELADLRTWRVGAERALRFYAAESMWLGEKPRIVPDGGWQARNALGLES